MGHAAIFTQPMPQCHICHNCHPLSVQLVSIVRCTHVPRRPCLYSVSVENYTYSSSKTITITPLHSLSANSSAICDSTRRTQDSKMWDRHQLINPLHTSQNSNMHASYNNLLFHIDSVLPKLICKNLENLVGKMYLICLKSSFQSPR